MAPVPSLKAVLSSVLAVTGIIGIYLAFSVLVKVLIRPEEAMESFQEGSRATVRDFQILIIVEAMMVGGFIMYTLGGLGGNTALLNTARIVAILFTITIGYIFFRWERRITWK